MKKRALRVLAEANASSERVPALLCLITPSASVSSAPPSFAARSKANAGRAEKKFPPFPIPKFLSAFLAL
jgi:hypothetical protein